MLRLQFIFSFGALHAVQVAWERLNLAGPFQLGLAPFMSSDIRAKALILLGSALRTLLGKYKLKSHPPRDFA
jgi:hypothetical protein